MRNDVITLVSKTYQNDTYGIERETVSTSSIYCDVRSITQTEFYEGAKVGMKPEYRFDVFVWDYDGQPEVIYDGVTYTVYRTYQASPDVLELYVQRDMG